MITFVIVIHVMVCILLATIILMQSGRGGGLTQGFAAAETMFGAKTNSVLIKGTTILATLFLTACLSLAFMSAQKERSLMSNVVPVAPLTKEMEKTAETKQAATTDVEQAHTSSTVIPPPEASTTPEMAPSASTGESTSPTESAPGDNP